MRLTETWLKTEYARHLEMKDPSPTSHNGEGTEKSAPLTAKSAAIESYPRRGGRLLKSLLPSSMLGFRELSSRLPRYLAFPALALLILFCLSAVALWSSREALLEVSDLLYLYLTTILALIFYVLCKSFELSRLSLGGQLRNRLRSGTHLRWKVRLSAWRAKNALQVPSGGDHWFPNSSVNLNHSLENFRKALEEA